MWTPDTVIEAVTDARRRTLDLVADLSDEQLLGPRLAILNPFRWEIGHVAWFQEKWVIRRGDLINPSLREDSDALYDSMAVPHDTRWDLPLPSRSETVAYLCQVRDATIGRITRDGLEPELLYFTLLSVFHEDMHNEAFTYTRQTLEYPPPVFTAAWLPPHSETSGREGSDTSNPPFTSDCAESDARIDGGTYHIGAANPVKGCSVPFNLEGHGYEIVQPFVFDNEKWAHPVEVAPFSIARTAVTQAQFAEFVEDGGYGRTDCWSREGWEWKEEASAVLPVYWRRGVEGGWERRFFDRWVPLEPTLPVIHVNWFEADAFCRWAGRRLPTEAEWEIAAAWAPIARQMRPYPWGNTAPMPGRANLDWRGGQADAGGCIPVGALPSGDSPSGCRQMIGNVWEWTASAFGPYPGFVPDPYREYSEPWFGDHKVLRGGCWVTRSRLIRNTWRNFYRPDRRDVLAGFRTCALQS